MSDNRFIALIDNGSIADHAGLKDAYRSLVMSTHPDHAGNSRIEEFLRLEDDYQEAVRFLHTRNGMTEYREENARLLFFQELRKIDGLETPYYLDKEAVAERLLAARGNAERYFRRWRGENTFAEAIKEHDVLKHEKKKNTLAELYKPPDFERIRPLSFSITYFHLTGQPFYRIQVRRLGKPVLNLLTERRFTALTKYYSMLIDDTTNGPAIDG
ncbi:MAG: hypothetical protein AABZ39_16855 [Spirochaetota bacterium]